MPPELEGRNLELHENVSLSDHTTLRIGGPARVLARVHDAEALGAVLAFARRSGLPVLLLGKGSNILVPDEGYPGVVVKLAGGAFEGIEIDGAEVRAGAGVSLMRLFVAARDRALSGLENLSGIPSSLGGAIRINAGSYGTELFDLLTSVSVVRRSGERVEVPADQIPHGYRWTALMEGDDIVTGGTLRLRPRPREEIDARFREVCALRGRALPKQPNAGSIFKNPPDRSAGKLLEACGLKGRRVGNAMVSEIHANVIVNLGGASARDVTALMEEMRQAVADRFGVVLVPEIERIPGAGGPGR